MYNIYNTTRKKEEMTGTAKAAVKKVVPLNTLLYDGKNEKYNRFPKLVAVSKEGVYGFKAAK
jgi:hypothetical protein